MIKGYDNVKKDFELDTERHAIFRYYIKMLGISNIKDDECFCILGKNVWDVRVVNLKDVEIYRFSNPQYKGTFDELNSIRRKFSLLKEENLCAIKSLGIFDKQVWYKRTFYKSGDFISSKIDNKRNIKFWVKVIIDVLQYVKILWNKNIFHGDISMENIVLDNEKYILVDPMFFSVFCNNKIPSFEDDIIELKTLFKKIIDVTNFTSLSFLIESLDEDSIDLIIDKVRKIEEPLFIPMSSGVILKKNDRKISPISSLKDKNLQEENQLEKIINNEKKVPEGKIFFSPKENNRETTTPESPVNVQKFYDQVPRSESITIHNSQDKSMLYLLIFCLLGVLLFYNKDKLPKINFFNSNQEKLLEYEYNWSSNQPIFMKEIVTKALNGDPLAQVTIVNFEDDEKNGSPYVNTKLLQIIFNQMWENELNDDDKYTAFRLGVPKLISSEEKKVPLKYLKDLHPAISLAVSGSVALDAHNSQLKEISLNHMSSLNGIYGGSFKKLSILGVKTLDELSSRALSSIFVLGESDEAIAGFLVDSVNNQVMLRGKILILLDLEKENFVTSKKLFEIISKYFHKPLAPLLDFFNTKDWAKVDPQNILNFMVGKFSEGSLDVQQYIDLLSYPLKSVREQSVKVLSESPKLNKKVLDFIADGNSKLSREQIYILLSLFLIDGNKQHAVVEKFFDENPDKITMLSILLFRNAENADDIFNFEAARYLSHQSLEIPEGIIWELAKHPEPMARAIAYSRLDLNNPIHKSFLEKKKKTESSDMLKVLISKRLE